MKTLAFSVLLAVGTTSAFAQGGSLTLDTFVSTKTRAEVRADLARAKDAGRLVDIGERAEVTQPAAVTSRLSRAVVRTDAQADVHAAMPMRKATALPDPYAGA